MVPRKVQKLSLLCTLKLVEHSKSIVDVGDVTPFHVLEPVLRKMPTNQLVELETNSPHLQLFTQKIWHDAVKKEFPDAEVSPDSDFRDVYQNLAADLQQRRQRALSNLKQNYKKIEIAKSQNETVRLSQEKSARYIALTTTRKRKKLFFDDNTAPAMKKVMKGISERSKMFQPQRLKPVQTSADRSNLARFSRSKIFHSNSNYSSSRAPTLAIENLPRQSPVNTTITSTNSNQTKSPATISLGPQTSVQSHIAQVAAPSNIHVSPSKKGTANSNLTPKSSLFLPRPKQRTRLANSHKQTTTKSLGSMSMRPKKV